MPRIYRASYAVLRIVESPPATPKNTLFGCPVAWIVTGLLRQRYVYSSSGECYLSCHPYAVASVHEPEWDISTGKQRTTSVLRGNSRLKRSIGIFVYRFLQCDEGKSKYAESLHNCLRQCCCPGQPHIFRLLVTSSALRSAVPCLSLHRYGHEYISHYPDFPRCSFY